MGTLFVRFQKQPHEQTLDRLGVMAEFMVAGRLRPRQLQRLSVLLPANGAQSRRPASSLPTSVAITGSWRNAS